MTAGSLALAAPGARNPHEKDLLQMTQDDRTRTPMADRRDHIDRRNEQRTDRRAHERYTPIGAPANRCDRRQGERRRG
jgi:hypothetical protein